MANVHIRINTKEYDVACDNGQEEQLKLLAAEVDERAKMLTRSMGTTPGDPMVLALTAIMMADEIAENKREIHNIATEVQRLASLVNEDKKNEQEGRMQEIEQAMATTLEEIAARIETIADRAEIR